MLAWVKYRQILSEKLYWDGGDWLTRWYLVKFLLLPNYCSVMSERVGADPELWPAPHMCRLCHWWRVATSTGPGLHLTGHRWFRPKYTVKNFSCLCVNLIKRNILMISSQGRFYNTTITISWVSFTLLSIFCFCYNSHFISNIMFISENITKHHTCLLN